MADIEQAEMRCIWDGHADLGECPLWDHRSDRLFFIDITKKQLHSVNSEGMDHQYWQMPKQIACIGLCNDGGLVAALEDEIVFIDTASGGISSFTGKLLNASTEIFNDGKVDPNGGFVVGSKDPEGIKPVGRLFRISPDGSVNEYTKNRYRISNGLDWDTAKRCFYHTDYPNIYRWGFNPETNVVEGQRVFVSTKVPDGLCLDQSGDLWSAEWDGWGLNQFSCSGELKKHWELPVQRPTSCCFGGENLGQLFVTSARYGLSEAELQSQPHAGGIFKIRGTGRGCRSHEFQRQASIARNLCLA